MKSLFLILSLSLSLFADEQIRWSEGEHLELGDNGAKAACSELGLSNSECPALKNIPRNDEKVSFSYGELIMAVDYYQAPGNLSVDTKSGVKKIIKCAHKQMFVHPEQEKNEDAEYASCTMTGVVAMPGYLEVVSKNYDHFGWHNMVAYVKYHELALKKAVMSYQRKKSNPSSSRYYLHQALIYNAFADHYLSDAFASGHLRVPRTQIVNWAEKNLKGLFKGTRGDLLTMILHDRESISLKTQKEVGVGVENARGDMWTTRGDSHLHMKSYDGDPVRELPESAIKESVKEVLTAYMTGEVPEGIYQASQYVPFYRGIPLALKLSPEYQEMNQKDFIKAFYSGMPFYEKFIHRKADLEAMLNDLPMIYKDFQKDVRKAVDQKPELRQRLPASYLDAYINVH
jgi:hypothetical protein